MVQFLFSWCVELLSTIGNEIRGKLFRAFQWPSTSRLNSIIHNHFTVCYTHPARYERQLMQSLLNSIIFSLTIIDEKRANRYVSCSITHQSTSQLCNIKSFFRQHQANCTEYFIQLCSLWSVNRRERSNYITYLLMWGRWLRKDKIKYKNNKFNTKKWKSNGNEKTGGAFINYVAYLLTMEHSMRHNLRSDFRKAHKNT